MYTMPTIYSEICLFCHYLVSISAHDVIGVFPGLTENNRTHIFPTWQALFVHRPEIQPAVPPTLHRPNDCLAFLSS